MEYLTGALSIGLVIGIGVLIFLVLVVIAAWIIKIGVKWAIGSSSDILRGIVREAILSTSPDKKDKDFISRLPKMGLKEKPADAPEICPNCGAKKPRFGGALDEIKCSKCGHKF